MTEPNEPQKLNTDYFKQSADPIESTPGRGRVSHKDWVATQKYLGLYPTLTDDRRLVLSDSQSWYSKVGNAHAQITSGLIPEILAQASAILDPRSYKGDGESQFAGHMRRWANRKIATTKAENPIFYRSDDPLVNHSLSDLGFWLQNGADLYRSAGAFVATGYGVAAITRLPKLLKAGKVLNSFIKSTTAGQKVALAGNSALTSYALTHAEGFGVALGVYDKSREKYLKDNPDNEEGANRYAAERASAAYNFNRVNFLLNLSSAYMFLKPGALSGTTSIVNAPSIWATTKKMGVEGMQEYAEETVNHLAEGLGMNEGYTVTDGVRDAISAEGISAGILGFIGGVSQTGMTIGVSNVYQQYKNYRDDKGFVTDRRLQYEQQQKVLKEFAEITSGGKIKDLTSFFESATRINALIGDAQNAYDRGDQDAYEAISKKLVVEQAYKAFQSGTTESLLSLYQEIGNMSEEALVAEGFEQNEIPGIREKAGKALKTITGLEKAYNKSRLYLNGRDVYSNRANDLMLNGYVEQIQQLVSAQVSDTKQAVDAAIAAGVASNKMQDIELVWNPDRLLNPAYPTGTKERVAYEQFIDELKNIPEVALMLSLQQKQQVLQKAINNNNKDYFDLTSSKTQRDLQKQEDFLRAAEKLNSIQDDTEYQDKLDSLKKAYTGKINPAVVDALASKADEMRRETAKAGKKSLKEKMKGIFKRKTASTAAASTAQQQTQQPPVTPPVTPPVQPAVTPVTPPVTPVQQPAAAATTPVTPVSQPVTPPVQQTPQQAGPTVVTNPPTTRSANVVNAQAAVDTTTEEEADAWGELVNSMQAESDYVRVDGDSLYALNVEDFTTQNLAFFSKAIDAVAKRIGREPNFQEIVDSFISSVGIEPFKRHSKTLALLYVHRTPAIQESLTQLDTIINNAVNKQIEQTYEQTESVQDTEPEVKVIKTYDQLLEFDETGNVRIINDASTVAYNKVAYLSVNYDKVVITTDDLTEVSRQDIQSGDNPIVVNKETPGAIDFLLSPVGWRTGVTLRVSPNAADVPVTKDHQADTIEKVPFKSLNLQPGSEEYAARVPIEIVAEDGTVMGYLHDTMWVDTHNVAESAHDTIAEQRRALLDFRASVVFSENGLSTELVKTSIGKSGRLSKPVPLSVANPDPNTKIISIAANGELRESQTSTISPDDILGGKEYVDAVSADSIGRMFELRPIPHTEGGPKYIMLSVKYGKVSEEAAYSVSRAVEAYLLPNLPENARIVQQIQQITKIDITSPEGLERYISLFMNTQKGIQGGDYSQVYKSARTQAELSGTSIDNGNGTQSVIPFSLPFIGVQHGSIVFGQVNSLTPNGEEFFHMHPKAMETANAEDVANLRENLAFLVSALVEKTFNYQFAHSTNNPNVALVQSDGSVKDAGKYIDNVKSRTLTNIPSYAVPTAEGTKYVTYVQPTIRITTPEVAAEQQVQEEQAANAANVLEAVTPVAAPEAVVGAVYEGVSNDANAELRNIEEEFGTEDLFSQDMLRQDLFSREMTEAEESEIQEYIASRRIGGLTVVQQAHVTNYLFNVIAEAVQDSRNTKRATKWGESTGKVNFDEVLAATNKAFDSIVDNKLASARLKLKAANDKVAAGATEFVEVANRLNAVVSSLATLESRESRAKLLAIAFDQISLYMDVKLKYNKALGTVEQYILGRDNKLQKLEQNEEESFSATQDEITVLDASEDGDNSEDFDTEEQSNERVYSKSSIEMDQKATVTTRFRRFMTGIKLQKVGDTGQLEDVKGFMGLPVYVPYDTAFNTVSGAIARGKATPDLATMIDLLKTTSEAIPWFSSLVSRLQDPNLDEQIKREFVVTMAKHSAFMQFAMYSRTKYGTVLRLYDSDANATERLIYMDWVTNFKASPLVKADGDGNYYIDKEEAKAALDVYNKWNVKAPKQLSSVLSKALFKAIGENFTGYTSVSEESLTAEARRGLEASLAEDGSRMMYLQNQRVTVSKSGKFYEIIPYKEESIQQSDLTQFLSYFGITLSEKAEKAMLDGKMEHRGNAVSQKQLLKLSDNTAGVIGALAFALNKVVTADAPISATEENPLDQGVVKSLAKLEANYTDRAMPNSVRTGDKTVYPYTQSKYITDRIEDLQTDRFGVLAKLMSSEFSRNSIWLQMLASSEEFEGTTIQELMKDEMDIKHLDLNALKEHGKRHYRNSDIASLPDADHEMVKLTGLQDTRQGSEFVFRGRKYRMGTFFVPTMSDKGSMVMLKMPSLRIDSSDFQVDDDGNLDISTDLINNVFEQGVMPEFLRIVQFHKDIKATKISGYDLGAKMFNFFPAINALKVEHEGVEMTMASFLEIAANQGLDAQSILLNFPQVREAMVTVVRKTVEEKVAKKIKIWQESGYITTKVNEKTKATEVVMPYFDAKYISRFGKQTPDHLAKMIAADFVISYLNANANTFMMVIGDPATFAKTDSEGFNFSSKFNDSASREDLTIEDYTMAVKNTFINIGKRLASLIAPGQKMAESTNETYRTLFLKDRVAMSTEIAYLSKVLDGKEFDLTGYNQMTSDEKKVYVKGFPNSMAYMKIKGTDGQEYTTWQEHLHILEQMAKTPGYASDIGLKEIVEVRDLVSRGVKTSRMSPRQRAIFKKVFQPLKPVYTGQHFDPQAKTMRFVYVKTSSIPLLPQMVAGTELEKLEKYMQENKLERAVYSSGVKTGFTTTPIDIWTQNGRISMPAYSEDSVMRMERRNFRIQQDKPYKGEKGHINLGTQESKELFGDILEVDDFEYNGEKLTGLQLYDKYNDAFRRLYQLKQDALFTELGVERDVTGILVPTDTATTMKALQRILVEEAESRGYNASDIEGLEIQSDGRFVMPLWTHVNAGRYEALLVSIINNEIIKNKMPGFSMVIASEEGFLSDVTSSMSEELKVSQVPELQNTATRTFRLLIKDDGTLMQPTNVPDKYEDQDAKLVQFFSVEHAYQAMKSGTFDENVHASYYNWAKSHSFKVDGKVFRGTLAADVNKAKELMTYLTGQSFMQNPKHAATQALVDTNNSTIEYDVEGDARNEYMPELLTYARRIMQARESRKRKQEAFETYQSRIVWTSKWDGKLHGSREIDGKVQPQQVLLPSRFKDDKGNLIDIYETDAAGAFKYIEERTVGDKTTIHLREEMFQPETLRLFGFRIPTSKQLSMHTSEIVGFLPPEAGDLVIESRDLITQTGQDFDIDMKYFYQYNMAVDSTGKVIVDNATEKHKTENEIIAIHHAIFTNSNPAVQKQILSPLSVDKARIAAEQIEKAAVVDDKFFTPLSDEYQKEKLISGSHGRTGTGAYSLDIVFHAGTQILAAKGTPISLSVPVVMVGKNGPFIGWAAPSIRMGKYRSDGTIGRSSTLDGNRTISDVLSERQNLSVDNEKEQIMGRINLNGITMDADKAMNLLGFDLDTYKDGDTTVEVSLREYFLSQPILKRYVQLMSLADSSISEYGTDKRAEVIRQLREEFKTSSESMSLNYIATENSSPTASFNSEQQTQMHMELDRIGDSLSGKNLKDAIDGKFTGDMNAFQQGILVQFIMLSEMGLQIRDVQTTVNADSKGLGKSLVHVIARAERVAELASKKNRWSFINNAEKLIGDVRTPENDAEAAELVDNGYVPILNVYIKPDSIQGYATVYGIDAAFQLYLNPDNDRLKLFPYLDAEFRSNVGEVISYTGAALNGDVSTGKRTELYEHIIRESRRYLNSLVAFKNAENPPASERERLLMDRQGKPSLASYIRSLPPSYIKANAFLSLLLFDVNVNGKDPSLIKFNSATGTNFDEQHLYDAVYELLSSKKALPDFQGNEYNTQKLAQDLITYAYLEGGIQEAIQFSKFMPMTYLKNSGIIDFLRTPMSYNSLFKSVVDQTRDALPSEYALQYFQHNPERAARYSEKSKDGTIPELVPVYALPTSKQGVIAYRMSPAAARTEITNENFPMFISTYDYGVGFKLYMRTGKMVSGGQYIQIPTLGTEKPGTSEYNSLANYKKTGGFIRSVVYANNPLKQLPLAISTQTAPDATQLIANTDVQNAIARFDLQNLNTKDLSESDIVKLKQRMVANNIEMPTQAAKVELSEMVEYLKQTVKSPYTDFLLTDLGKALGVKTAVLYKSTDTTAFAFYSPTTDTIYVNSNYLEQNTKEGFKDITVALTVAHEMIHAVTANRIDSYFDPSGPAVSLDKLPEDLRNLWLFYQDVKSRLYVQSPKTARDRKINYTLSSIHEFTVGTLTSLPLIEELASIPSDTEKNKTLLDKLISILSEVYAKAAETFGLKVEGTMAELAMSYSYNVMLAAQKTEDSQTTQETQIPSTGTVVTEQVRPLVEIDTTQKKLVSGAVVNIRNNRFVIANINHDTKESVRVFIGDVTLKIDYDEVVKQASIADNLIGTFPVVTYNNQQFVVTDNGVYSAIKGKKVAYEGHELKKIIALAGQPVQNTQVPKTSYTPTFAKVSVLARIPMNFEDGDRGNTMRQENSGKSTMDLILEGKRTATTRGAMPMAKEAGQMNSRNLREGDTIEFFDDKGRTALVEVTSDPYQITKITPENWSLLEGWTPETHTKIVARTDGNAYQFTYRLLDYKYDPTKISKIEAAPQVQEENIGVPPQQVKEEPPVETGIQKEDKKFTFSDGTIIDTDFQLTKQQEEALQMMADFLVDPSNENTGFSLRGFAGTGKTSIVKYLLKYIDTVYGYGSKKGRLQLQFAAPTHKAARVLVNAMRGKDTTGKRQVITTAKLLTKRKEGIGAAAKWVSSGKDLIPDGGLLVIDESSMLNEADTAEILQLASDKMTKVIFMGDPAQIPSPSRGTKAMISPALFQETQYELTEVKRQEFGNPLFNIFNAIRNAITSKTDVFVPQTQLNDKGEGIEFTKDVAKFRERVIEVFKQFNSDPSLVKLTAYTNSAVTQWNGFIRSRTLPDAGRAQYQPGETLMGYDQMGDSGIQNGQDYKVIESGYTNDGPSFRNIFTGELINSAGYQLVLNEVGEDASQKSIDTFILDMDNPKNDAVKAYIYQLATEYNKQQPNYGIKRKIQDALFGVYSMLQVPSDLIAYNGKVTSSKELLQTNPQLFKRDPRTGMSPIDALEKAGKATKFAKSIDYGYAITVHKVQGSTYEHIMVDMDSIDIPATNREVYKPDGTVAGIENNMLKYVAFSRPRKSAIVFTTKAVEQAEKKVEQSVTTEEQKNPGHIVINNDELFSLSVGAEKDLPLSALNTVNPVEINGVSFELPSNITAYKNSLSPEKRAIFERLVKEKRIKPKCE